jgi:Trk K+ transport system NAD-binding subunit
MGSLVLVLGTGHLVYEALRQLEKDGYQTKHIPSNRFREQEGTPVEEESLDYARAVLEEVGINEASAVCLLDQQDRVNLHLLLAALACEKDIPAIVALRNEEMAYHLRAVHPQVHICNPAKIAVPHFLAALEACSEVKDKEFRPNKLIARFKTKIRSDHLAWHFVWGFLGLFGAGVLFFRITENAPWANCAYLMITIITSVNFNDVALKDNSFWTSVMRTILVFGTWAFVLLTIAFVIDYIVHRHTESFVYGRRKYGLNDHIILCGLGRFGYPLINALIKQKRRLIVIEYEMNNRYVAEVRARGVPVLIGDATLARTLLDAGIERAAAVVSTVNEDQINLMVGLLARALKPTVRIVLRLYDRGIAEQVKKRFAVRFTISTSALTVKRIREILKEQESIVHS